MLLYHPPVCVQSNNEQEGDTMCEPISEIASASHRPPACNAANAHAHAELIPHDATDLVPALSIKIL
jgi:hypothetical protein